MTPHFKIFMGGFFATLLLILAFGCAGNYKPPTNAQQAINEVKTVLIATKEMVADQVTSGVITPDEAQTKLNKTRALEKDLAKATDLLENGLDAEAWDKANLIRSAVNLLHKELAERARNER